MAIIRKRKRRQAGSRKFDPSDLRELLKDDRVWNVNAVVVKPDDATSHFEIIKEGSKIVDVLIEVETVPRGIDLTVRLGCSVGGPGRGLWRIPDIGTEVVVDVGDGELDGGPSIVAILGSGEVPANLAAGRTILVATDEVWVDAPIIKMGPDPQNIVTAPGPLQDSLVHGSGIDSFTGSPYSVLGSATRKVFARK
jgi:hypothetical protein